MGMFLNKKKKLQASGIVKVSSHYENIKDGDTLSINGKKYIKVELQFVDSLDHNTSEIIKKLEAELKLLNGKNKRLTEKLLFAENEVSLLRVMNNNLISGVSTESARLKTELKKQKQFEEHLSETIDSLNDKIQNQAKHITGLGEMNEKLKKTIKEKLYYNEKLEHKIHNMPFHQQTENSRKIRKRLNDKIDMLNAEIASLNDQLHQ